MAHMMATLIKENHNRRLSHRQRKQAVSFREAGIDTDRTRNIRLEKSPSMYKYKQGFRWWHSQLSLAGREGTMNSHGA